MKTKKEWYLVINDHLLVTQLNPLKTERGDNGNALTFTKKQAQKYVNMLSRKMDIYAANPSTCEVYEAVKKPRVNVRW